MRQLLAVALFVGGLVGVGCKDSDGKLVPPVTTDDVKREVGEAAKTTGEFVKQKQQEFVATIKKQLNGLDGQIDKLKEKGKELKEEYRPQWDAQMKKVAEKREQLEEKLESLKDASPDVWEKVKSGVDSAWKELQQAYDEAARTLKDSSQASPEEAAPKTPATPSPTKQPSDE